MIISRTPFRISLFGGSTDYESYYSKYGSLLIGMAIDKYCYISVRKTPPILPFLSKISYSQTEVILNNNKEIKHNGVRGVLEDLGINYGVEISHNSDLPAQTGIGSSSSFVVGLFKAGYFMQMKRIPDKLYSAASAIHIERQLLKEPGGIQDQIWASYGGFNSISIDKDGDFHVRPMPICDNFIQGFMDRSVVLYTGKTRQSFEIAASHDVVEDNILNFKHQIKEIAFKAYEAFEIENIDEIGALLHSSWIAKCNLSDKICNGRIHELYQQCLDNGAIGGKLLGSGGEGFLFLILKDNIKKSAFIKNMGLSEIQYNIDYQGSKIIYH